MKCKNCGHIIWGNWVKTALNKYVHDRGESTSNPSEYCFCGCTKPEPENEGI